MQNTASKPTQFATQIAGVPVLIASDWASEYFESFEVFPLPSASACLIGIAQVRGEVVPVFDPTNNYSLVTHARRKVSLMIVKTSGGMLGFAVESEPLPIQLGGPAYSGVPQVTFTGALSQPQMGSVISNDTKVASISKIWWQLDIENFFNELNKNSNQAVAA
jgi:chemotaxis signal transduction protein